MDWHDVSCRRLDLFECDGLQSCMSCGSTDTKLSPAPSPNTSVPGLPPIRRERPEVRLLRLLAGSFADEICCYVVVEDLGFKPEYIALSYTWADHSGDDTKCETILVNDEPFLVTRNCKLALLRARTRLRTVVIWVDAICIDQDDYEERGHQVKLMPQIYSRAQYVLVYVGESTERSVQAINSLKAGETLITLEDLFSRRYFSRVWILQEIALAKTALLVCGEDSIPWVRVVEAAELVIEAIERPAVLDLSQQVFLLPRQELRLLDLGRKCKATNPRDKVFALLGLLPNRCIGQVEADYTLTVEELYRRLAIELASSYDWSDVLVRAGACQRAISTLPSWAPDWSFNRFPDLRRWTSWEPYAAAPPCDPWVRLGIEGRSLRVRALGCTNSHSLSTSISCSEVHRWYAPRSSYYKSPSCTFFRINKDDVLPKMTIGRFFSLQVDLPQSPIQNYCIRDFLILDLILESDGAAWTLLQAFLEQKTYLYVPIENALKLFTADPFELMEIEQLMLQSEQVTPPSSVRAPEEDLWMKNFYQPNNGIKLDLHIWNDPRLVEANDKVWRYLVRNYLVREEWLEIR